MGQKTYSEEMMERRLTIGVDIRNLTSSFSGIPRYIYGMLSQLADRHDVKVYAPTRLHPDVPELPPHLSLRTGNYSGVVGRSFWSSTVVRRWAKEDKVDVFWGPSHRLPSLERNLPTVLTIHDMVWIKSPNTMRSTRRWAERFLMTRAVNSSNIVVAVSQSTASDLSEHFHVPRQQIPIIYPGVTSFAYQAGVGKVRPRFALFVGTFEPRKNLVRLVDAYGSLPCNVRHECKLILVGRHGWKMPDLRQYITGKNLSDSIEIMSADDCALAELYDKCDFLALPSLYEGFGLPIIEANSFGAPVLTSNLSSMPEVGGRSAHLVDPYDVEDIANGLQLIITDRRYRDRLASFALINSKRFSWHQSSRAFERVLVEAAMGGRR